MFADQELGGAGGAGAGASAGQLLRKASPRGSRLHTPPRYPKGRQGSLRAAGRPDPGARG